MGAFEANSGESPRAAGSTLDDGGVAGFGSRFAHIHELSGSKDLQSPDSSFDKGI